MEKKDLKHLSRSELVDVICEMKKDTTNSNDLTNGRNRIGAEAIKG